MLFMYSFTYCALDNGLTLAHFRLCTFKCIYVQKMTRTGIHITSSSTEFYDSMLSTPYLQVTHFSLLNMIIEIFNFFFYIDHFFYLNVCSTVWSLYTVLNTPDKSCLRLK